VAIAAIDTVIADMMLVAELDWLLALDPLAGVPSRPGYLRRDPEAGEKDKDGAVNRGPRQIVRAMTENLWHVPPERPPLVFEGELVRLSSRAGGTSPISKRFLPKSKMNALVWLL
jgi:hypothetical protein